MVNEALPSCYREGLFALRRACPPPHDQAIMMTSMLTDDARAGDQVLKDGAVEYTLVWEPVNERTTALWRVRWEWDSGETDRTMPLGVDMPNLVRPIPPDPDPGGDPDPGDGGDPDPDPGDGGATPVDPDPGDGTSPIDPNAAPADPAPVDQNESQPGEPDPEPEQPSNP